MTSKEIIYSFALFFLPVSGLTDDSTRHSVDADTGAETWAKSDYGVSLSLTQILPEQAQAFYVNRGFTLKQIESFTSSCLYMTVLRNDSAAGTIHFIRDEWTIISAEKQHSLVSVDSWVKRLTTIDTPNAALVAFRWAQFPPEQSYQPGGDWNQGMLPVGLSSGSQFDLIARWDIEGNPFQLTVKQVQCAK